MQAVIQSEKKLVRKDNIRKRVKIKQMTIDAAFKSLKMTHFQESKKPEVFHK